MRFAAMCLTALLPLASTISCGSATAPCVASCDGDLVVYGRATISCCNVAVPGATVTVQLFADTTRTWRDCAGTTPLADVTQQLDAGGNYRLPIVASGAAGRWVCLEVTADPHGWASDVGVNHLSGGVIQLRPVSEGGQSDSIRVDLHYSELP